MNILFIGGAGFIGASLARRFRKSEKHHIFVVEPAGANVSLFLSESVWCCFELAIVEYMAAGKNVVATRVDAIPTLIDDGEDGLLVNADNREEAWKGSYGYVNIPDNQHKKLSIK